MTRYAFELSSAAKVQEACRIIQAAPRGARVEVKAQRRTNDQNALMWVLLTALSRQVKWHGLTLTPDDWKLMMLSGLRSEMRIVPNIAGNGFVNLGARSSDLSKQEMADLIELIYAFGAEHGVSFGGEQ